MHNEPVKANPFELQCPQVTNEAELLQYQALDLHIKHLSAKRKAENARLIAMEKLWELRKAAVADQVRAVLAQAKPPGSVRTLLGTTYTIAQEDHVTWNREHDEKLIGWLSQADGVPDILRDVESVTTLHLTALGREKAKQILLAMAKDGLEVPEFVTFTPAHKAVATRASGGGLDAVTILQQHQVGLERLAAPREQPGELADATEGFDA